MSANHDQYYAEDDNSRQEPNTSCSHSEVDSGMEEEEVHVQRKGEEARNRRLGGRSTACIHCHEAHKEALNFRKASGKLIVFHLLINDENTFYGSN